jgi:hypothetical protein
MDVSGKFHALVALPPNEHPAPIRQKAGWVPKRDLYAVMTREICPYWKSNSDPSVIQPLASSWAP